MKVLWEFRGTALAATMGEMADLDGDGRPETISATNDGFLYVLDTDGKPKLSKPVGATVTALVASASGSAHKAILAVGLYTGHVLMLDVFLAR